MSKLWIFGPSACTAYGLAKTEKAWPELLAEKLNCDFSNIADIAADNLLIYHRIISSLNQINDNDIVVVGWSHPNRKTFVADQDNYLHQSIIAGRSIVYDTDPVFFRSDNPNNDDPLEKLKFLKPKDQGVKYFDDWFKNYFSEYESILNFQAYIDSIEQKIPGLYIPFYFSKESIKGIKVDPNSLFYLEFIVDNQIYISENNMHANAHGHQMIANYLYNQVKTG